MKPTMTGLAEHIGKARATLYHMQKASPKQFDILWLGWVHYCLQKGMK